VGRVRKHVLVAPTLLTFAVAVFFGVAFGTWLPLLFCLPWLAGIVWFSRDAQTSREFPSMADASRERLWAR
jgi:hypothetical protein